MMDAFKYSILHNINYSTFKQMGVYAVFYIIVDIAPLGLYRQQLCKNQFVAMGCTSVL
jgi:hypothetical protein